MEIMWKFEVDVFLIVYVLWKLLYGFYLWKFLIWFINGLCIM